MLSRRVGALIAPLIAVVAVAALVLVIWVQTPESSVTIDDPGGVVLKAEMVRADNRTEQRGDFELNTATLFCDNYDGTLTVAVTDDDTVTLDWAVEPVGECDGEACIPVWIIGAAVPEFQDATFVGEDVECPPELQP